ncbi:Dabb family protein [Butyrivibrio sp. AE2032]|uniref:Dabb family protein n=1 Tax=Butyrivibrio sp. AE2032 TaxID=1458463 RepID=UPI000552809F|nr:Dabb family protein [Butyrivibrio sp. AE2032]
MKHYIIAKFKDRDDTERLLPEIKELFNETLKIPGVESFVIHKSNSTRENRYSIMIEMNLSEEGLNNFDASEVHKKWKDTYGGRLESKAIFDCD